MKLTHKDAVLFHKLMAQLGYYANLKCLLKNPG